MTTTDQLDPADVLESADLLEAADHLEPDQLEPVEPLGPRPGSRLARARTPRAVDVLRATAVEFGVCVRPFPLRRTDLNTGETEIVDVPCGSTRAAVCPSCAAKARKLRAQQCREGWHLTDEPDLTPNPPTDRQRALAVERAQITDAREAAYDAGQHDVVDTVAEAAAAVDDDLAATGVRGAIEPAKGKRAVRSTRRRDDVPDLPRRPATSSTLGRVFNDQRTGRAFRPSLFVTLTLDSYGHVDPVDHTPVDPTRYDYPRAARDALHFGKAVDRWLQNLRRVAGYDVQYFAAVEPQKRGAPHIHLAIRGTLPRATVKQLTAASYANVWWPATDRPAYDGSHLPTWQPDGDGGTYVDPGTGEALPTWREALDHGPDADPMHTVRFGSQVDVKGVLAGTPDAERAIGYLVKYLVKDLGDDLDPTTADQDHDDGGRADRDDPALKAAKARRADHVARLVEALRFEPCSPGCANWLRYGVQPKNAKAGMRPGCCRAKAHKPTHLGYGGRRVLVSRKWTGKDLADHRHDRKAHVLAILGRDTNGHQLDSDQLDPAASSATGLRDPAVVWEAAKESDPDVPPRQQRIMRAIAHQSRWRAEYRTAQQSSATDPLAVDPAA